MASKRRIHFHSLSLPPLSPSDTNEDVGSSSHSPHFLAALQVMAHVLAPLRKALVHFYMTCRKRDVATLPLEWRTLMALGKLFQQAVAPPSGLGDASISLATTASSSSSASSNNNNNNNDTDEPQNVPVSTQNLYPILEECLNKHHKTTQPADATQALQLLLETVQICTRHMPVTNQLWGALLDQCGLGLIAKQNLVGRKTDTDGDILQRTKRDMCMLWCPLELPFPTPDSDSETTLPQLLDQYCSKQPYTSYNKKKKKNKNYYDFDKEPYDFEVKIPTFGNRSNISTTTLESEKWKTTRSLQLTTLTTFLFLGIQRKQPLKSNGEDTAATATFNHAEVLIPLTLDVTKLCDPTVIPKTESKEYELVGGVLFDEGDYVPVLRDEGRVATKVKNGDNEEDEDDEAWKLLETEEVIPMSESDVLEFLKGEGAESDAPCGTMAIYRRVDKACQDEMNQLLSDIIISQVSGTLNSTAEFYIEEEIIEDEEDEDSDDEKDLEEKVSCGLSDAVAAMETIQE
ncbi:hypothetical protein IV203_029234 [Nitzschia inconspicua]|uniref:Uncharacterized protein n=1 Tax=Nitzschia inconspicua TaxID=303405 RepID=A0A9K3LRG2_9STRA|nr:hypothetical protein IV203_029234 [Nitzschia inconspicua]